MLFPLILLTACTSSRKPAGQEPLSAQKYELVWSDEFDYSGLPDSTKWSYDLGDGCPDNCNWGNNESQFYTNRKENARVENGLLLIEARRERMGKKIFTSARLVSRRKGDWQFGKIEVRAKVPDGRGTWPAIWMLPTDWIYGGWPNSGEIDIMEHVGHLNDTIYGSVHTNRFNHVMHTQVTRGIYCPTASTAFHTYSIEWDNEKIVFYLDGAAYLTFTNLHEGSKAWPFDQRFHLLLNVAVGGNWGGQKGVDDRVFPQRMEVDYVRVYSTSLN